MQAPYILPQSPWIHMCLAHVFLLSSILSGSYTLSASFFVGFPEPWGEGFYGNIPLRAKCSKNSQPLCNIGLYLFPAAAGGSSSEDGWARHCSYLSFLPLTPSMTSCSEGVLPHHSRKFPQRFAGRPISWRCFPHWISPFPDGPCPCQIENKTKQKTDRHRIWCKYIKEQVYERGLGGR